MPAKLYHANSHKRPPGRLQFHQFRCSFDVLAFVMKAAAVGSKSAAPPLQDKLVKTQKVFLVRPNKGAFMLRLKSSRKWTNEKVSSLDSGGFRAACFGFYQ